jgi:hypothetical protein
MNAVISGRNSIAINESLINDGEILASRWSLLIRKPRAEVLL